MEIQQITRIPLQTPVNGRAARRRSSTPSSQMIRALSAECPSIICKPTHAPNVVAERKSRNESQDTSKNIAPLFNRVDNVVRCCDMLQIRRFSSVTPQEVSSDSVQGVCRCFTDACTSLCGNLWITYTTGPRKLLVMCTVPNYFTTTPTTPKENSL